MKQLLDYDEPCPLLGRALDNNERILKDVDDREIVKLKKSVMEKLERLEWLITQPHQRRTYTPIEVGFVRSAIYLLNAIWK